MNLFADLEMSQSVETTEQTTSDKQDRLLSFDSWSDYLPWLAMSAVVLLTIFALYLQSRIWWCKWDSPLLLWSSDAWSKHNSQHLFDPYSFTHILHGLIYYAALSLIFRRRLSVVWLLFLAIAVESAWEILENSNAVIERYRAATASLDYFGDSITNALGDILSCGLGFFIARKFGFWRSLVLFALVEIVLIVWIRDSLLINIVMLIRPIESIKTWQSGA